MKHRLRRSLLTSGQGRLSDTAGRVSADHAIPVEDGLDRPLQVWLNRCRELAEGHCDGIEEPADELVALAAGDRLLMERACRLIVEALAHERGNLTLVQMEAFWRRAFEKGEWTWEPNGLERSPYLS